MHIGPQTFRMHSGRCFFRTACPGDSIRQRLEGRILLTEQTSSSPHWGQGDSAPRLDNLAENFSDVFHSAHALGGRRTTRCAIETCGSTSSGPCPDSISTSTSSSPRDLRGIRRPPTAGPSPGISPATLAPRTPSFSASACAGATTHPWRPWMTSTSSAPHFDRWARPASSKPPHHRSPITEKSNPRHKKSAPGKSRSAFIYGDPSGIRTRVTAVRGRRTRPLYDGAIDQYSIIHHHRGEAPDQVDPRPHALW